MHPSTWEVRIGTLIIIATAFLLNYYLPFLLVPFGLFVAGLIFIVGLIKLVRGHGFVCAFRDSALIIAGYFAKSWEILIFFS